MAKLIDTNGLKAAINKIKAMVTFTSLTSSASTNLSVTVNGVKKTVPDLYATYADRLRTARTIWGQSFTGAGNVSGNMTGVGSITASGAIKTGSSSYNDGYIELYGTTPFIDFHYGKSTADYTARIAEYNKGTLTVESNLNVYGQATMKGFTDNGEAFINIGDATLSVYGARNTTQSSSFGDETLCLQTCFDTKNGKTDSYVTSYPQRCVLALQPRGGYVGIGTASPSYKLDVSGTMRCQSVTQTSDATLKDILGDACLTVDDIAAAPAIRFRWKKDGAGGAAHVGSTAQYWRGVMPEAVAEAADGTLSMDYGATALVSVVSLAREVKRLREMLEKPTPDPSEEG